MDNKMVFEVFSKFDINDAPISAKVCNNGHINSTYFVKCEKETYVLQKINTVVFKNPEQVMANIFAVTEHFKNKGLRTLEFYRTKSGENCYWHGEECYRVYKFIDDACTYNSATPELLEEAAYTFGKFQADLADFPAEKLYESIPNFHNTAMRYKNFEASVEKDPKGRAKECMDLIERIRAHKDEVGIIVDLLEKGEIPTRVVHNDTKLNNVLIGNDGRGVCVIDLDTIMPGSLLFDFGDAIRIGGSNVVEGSLDYENTFVREDLYSAFAKGFLRGIGGSITEKERYYLPLSAFMITFEQAIRFLTDYIDGDVYYKIEYENHNFDRAKGQLILAEDIYSKMDKLRELV